MDEELANLLFDLMTKDYKDVIKENKDMESYLKDKTKKDLLYLYLLYGYAGSEPDIYEEIKSLKNKSEIINKLTNYLQKNILKIFQFFSPERMKQIRKIASHKEIFKMEDEPISLDIVNILAHLSFIYCKREKNTLYIHMPQFIRDKVNSIKGDIYSKEIDEIVTYTKGMVNVYGAINLNDAYKIMKTDIKIEIEKYENILSFVSLLELDTIYYSLVEQTICNFNIRDEDIKKIKSGKKDLVIYEKELYLDMADYNYLYKLDEYREFRNYLDDEYNFDINDDEEIRDEVVLNYVETYQINQNEAEELLDKKIDEYFETSFIQKKTIKNYIDKIRKKFPVWKLGGKIDNIVTFQKIGRNNQCPCRKWEKIQTMPRKINLCFHKTIKREKGE